MNLKLLISIIFIYSVQAFGANPSLDGFHKRFKFIRNDQGTVVAITDKSLSLNFSVWTYVDALKKELLNEQNEMKNKGNYFSDAKNILFEDGIFKKSNNSSNDNIFKTYMMDSLYGVEKLNINTIFNNSVLKEVISSYETKLKSLMMNLRLDVVAQLDDPKYFYTRNLGYQAVKFGLDLARKKLSTIPLLNAASDIIVKVEKLVRERRIYHQNMLLYYLDNFAPETLGLTKDEADRAFSSIYESRISAISYWESNQAQAQWLTYGTDAFYNGWRMANRTLLINQQRYGEIGERLTHAFNDVTLNDKKVIINLFDQQSMIQWYPSVAYDYTRPNFVKRRRELHRLVQVGMSFITIPAFFKDTITSYIESTYAKQRLTEGSLYAFFEAHQMDEMKNRMIRQTMNPFETIK
ncbi:MAG: hypothetical protein A2381_08455 [Bdellovibrionales bacterium RIFOXYB1_FULL_37_110]|nr:MAG: hypothetical protein A2417_14130 [Bdellovibrionales bacterium RIFOXYC1_FULL_37_79]OFZ58237.1 MAG: hypothetical protein A2381_08455 [Bdellovibrionales bacterium RIFOXYB1_FULL_37_110]OFZ62290.1 MAG: hypothetical protein A2577_17080 [Bdellovibrionales bacterium RIFOXYD1_FULL_36_51]OFZ74013.1 MAG: hypothetical protein A2451_09155 [Bdellovibrionales bacterium RIFOXYC2_FULL_39_8]